MRMAHHLRLLGSVVITLCVAWPAAAQVRTPKKAVTDTYHGVKIADEYQWLENAADPTVKQWTRAQNDYARGYLDKLPTRTALAYDLDRLLDNVSAEYSALKVAAGKTFAIKFKPPAQQAVLVWLKSPNDIKSEKVILDPNQVDRAGGTSIDFYEPSLDGKFVAVSLSESGSEAGTVYVYDAATGEKLSDVVTRVQFPTAGGSVAWSADTSGFFYTRYPHPGERPAADERFYQQVYFHKLGTPSKADRYEIGKEFPRIAEIDLKSSFDGRFTLATVSNGDGGEYAHYLRQPSGDWKQITRFEDRVKQVEFGREPLYIELPHDASLYLLSRKDAPRGRILKLPLSAPSLADAKEVIKESTNAIQQFVASASGLYIEDLVGGPSEIRFHHFYPNPEAEPAEEAPRSERRGRRRDSGSQSRIEWRLPLRGIYSVQELVCRRGDELLVRTVRFTEPYTWYSYDPHESRDRIDATSLKGTSPAVFSDVEVVRESVTSKDGTKVPLSIIQRKGTRRNGTTPAILTGYGGFGISTTPRFDFTRRIWIDQGGIIAVANLRGGGEFGEEWHRAGNLTSKQNVFDDFIACAEFLVRSNYTSPQKLAIQGGSNGGLLMGAAMTQRPDLFKAVVAHVGIFDMLRLERDPNGEYNTTEYGSVKVPDQFRALLGYSPYHRVKTAIPYPATLILTGEHDGRVNPAHSRKMTARLQAATKSKQPVLLRTSSKSGHGLGTALNERVAQLVDVYSFLMEQLGIEYSQVSRGPWIGAVTPTSATLKARASRDDLPVRLALSTSPLLARPQFSAPVRPTTNRHNIVSFPLNGLKPDTEYHYALEVGGKLDRTKRGQFRTHPPAGPASFNFAFASCADTASTSEVFDRIRENRPLFFLHVGDFHYLNLNTNDVGRFRAAYDQVLASPQQADLYRSTAFNYNWDDHDFGGNNANRKASSHLAVRTAYQEYVPHYPLGAGSGNVPIYHSFSVGRVKFIVTDLRSERDDPRNKDDENKSMMGAEQKKWFKQELLSANGKYPLIFWVTSVPWLGMRGSNYYNVRTNVYGFLHETNLTAAMLNVRTNRSTTNTNRSSGSSTNSGSGDDHWSAFSTERREICDFIKANDIKGFAILHGDAHMLGADDGRNSDYSTGGGGARIPVMCGGPLDQNASVKGGPYSQGVYRFRRSEGGFGFVRITDRGNEIEVRYSGLSNKNEEKVSLQFKVPANPAKVQHTKR